METDVVEIHKTMCRVASLMTKPVRHIVDYNSKLRRMAGVEYYPDGQRLVWDQEKSRVNIIYFADNRKVALSNDQRVYPCEIEVHSLSESYPVEEFLGLLELGNPPVQYIGSNTAENVNKIIKFLSDDVVKKEENILLELLHGGFGDKNLILDDIEVKERGGLWMPIRKDIECVAGIGDSSNPEKSITLGQYVGEEAIPKDYQKRVKFIAYELFGLAFSSDSVVRKNK